MPLFLYTLTRGDQTKLVEMRKGNPQGWLLQVVHEAFPEMAARVPGTIMRTRLVPTPGVKQSWSATVLDEVMNLSIQVIQKKR